MKKLKFGQRFFTKSVDPTIEELQKDKKIGRIIKIAVGSLIFLVIFAIFYGISRFYDHYQVNFYFPLRSPITIQERKTEVRVKEIKIYVSPTPDSSAAPAPKKLLNLVPKVPQADAAALNRWEGLASYYSRAGCIGCSANFTMANGQPLIDSALTVAFNDAPMGSSVRITNKANGSSVIAKVTDTGGFKAHGKIIDLTIGTRDAIGCASTCSVIVEQI